MTDRANKKLPPFKLVFHYRLPSSKVEDSMSKSFLCSLTSRDGLMFTCHDQLDFIRAVGVLREMMHGNAEPVVFFRHVTGKPVRWLTEGLSEIRYLSCRFDIRYDLDINTTLTDSDL
jgi:hypothetical protein